LAAHPQVRDIPIRVFFFMKNMVDFLPAPAAAAAKRAGSPAAALFLNTFITMNRFGRQIKSIDYLRVND